MKCESCGQVLDENPNTHGNTPCPHCGNVNREVLAELCDEVPPPHDILEGKVRVTGKKKPVYEFQDGEDLQVSTGKWVTKERIIDRENDKYREVVTDPESGNVIHLCKEPLTQHWGHGSAKDKG